MSGDFWWGMFTIPAAALAVALTLGAVVTFIWYSERFELGNWKLWPKRMAEYNRASMSAIVACARSVRYFWIPGWHIVICRTRLYRSQDSDEHERHGHVRDAVRQALAEVDRG